MMTRLMLTILLGAAVIRSVMAAAPAPAPARSDSELCAELTREVNISAERGLLTPQEAKRISERCYRLYGGN